MPDSSAYQSYLENASKTHESLCKKCGACCGRFEGDPCRHLFQAAEGQFLCSVYEDRLGLQQTVGGREFRCVPLRKILFESWAGSWRCGYRQSLKSEAAS